MTYVDAVLSTMGGGPCVKLLILAPLPWPSPTVDGQTQRVCWHAQSCHCTGWCHRPCAPSPPDKVLPSYPHPTLEGFPMPTEPSNLLARVTSCSGTPSLAPSLMASSTPSLLPFTFGSKVHLSSGGGTAHPFCVGGQTPPPWKRTQRIHQLCCVGQHNCPQAPNPQEHLLCRQQHWPHAPNQSTLNRWA